LITGCSAGGIGGALAEAFHEKGYHVFATLRTPSKIPQSLSGAANATILKLDVLSSESIAAAVESVKRETGGRLDVLVNNSGRVSVVPGLDASIEEAKKLFDLNLWAPMAMFQAFAPLLIKAKGCIVNNSSASTYARFPFSSKCVPDNFSSHSLNKLGIYNSSKAALTAASETWRLELQPLGVRTITLITCGVKTNGFENYQEDELPETSSYSGVRDLIRDISNGRLQANAMDPRQYAATVVRSVEKGTVGEVWVGKDAFAARVGSLLSPQPILVSHFSNPLVVE
jgi:NAD(P)-dependent dehydrogenase (short-subunit alcohol dehydrogenase family)